VSSFSEELLAKQLKPPIAWYGGKSKLVKKILPLIPKHNSYIEVFSGSAAVMLAKDVSQREIINDRHTGIVNFYRVIRDPETFSRFQYLVNLTPVSRDEFVFCKNTWKICEDPVEKAYRWFIVIRQSYGSLGGAFDGSSVGSYLAAIDRLLQIHQRLRSVEIENLDFRKLIAKYDRPEAFFYLDPPYVLSTRTKKAYDHEMTDKDHEELVDILLGLKGNAMLSGYNNPIYKRLEQAEWQRHDFEVKTSMTSWRKKDNPEAVRIESLWVKP
jgi:DNA adenine methylase